MSILGDQLADAMTANDPQRAHELGIAPPPDGKTAKEVVDRKLAMQQRRQEAFEYIQTVARMAEKYVTNGSSIDSAVGKAQEFIGFMNQYAEKYMAKVEEEIAHWPDNAPSGIVKP